MTAPLLLTEAEAAERLRLCPRTLRKARAEVLLRYILIGRAIRYTVEDLESFIALLRKVQMPCVPPIPHSSPPRSGAVSGSSRSGASASGSSRSGASVSGSSRSGKRGGAGADIIPFRERQRRG